MRPAAVGGVEVIHDGVKPVSCHVRKIHLCHVERSHSWPAESLVAKRIRHIQPGYLHARTKEKQVGISVRYIILVENEKKKKKT